MARGKKEKASPGWVFQTKKGVLSMGLKTGSYPKGRDS
jgi:hypothetical protein